jgi:O-antigen ligase/tetratricopeptide (TPR) repeat protein
LDRQRLLAASLGIAVFLIPSYPAFITLTGAPVPGIALLPRPLTIALLVLAGVIAVTWIVALARAPKRPAPTVLAVAAFPLAALLAAVLGFDPLAGALFVLILGGGVLWHATILRFARDETALHAIFRAYLVSGALAALAAIVMVLAKTPVALYTIGHGRATGTFVLPGELAGYLIVYLPVAFAIARTLPELRAPALAGLGAGAVAFAMTFSRAGFVGMAAAIAAFVLMRRRERGARYAVAIMGAAVVLIGLAFNAHHDPSENFTRLSIWDAALRIARDFPFSGAGPFEFPRLYEVLRDPGGEPVAFHAHSVLLTIAAETGVVGLAAVLFGWLRFAAVLRARLRSPGALAPVSVAIAAGLIGTWVQGLIDTISVVIFGLWLPFMALAVTCAGDLRAAGTRVGDSRATGTLADDLRAAGVTGTNERPIQRDPYTLDAEELRRPDRRARKTFARGAAATAAAVVLAACVLVQLASDALYARAAAPGSLVAALGRLGDGPYEAIERVAPLPFVEAALATYDLNDARLPEAARHAARIPSGPVRSDLDARIAQREGREADAIRAFLDAGDDGALQPIVYRLAASGRVREAYQLERRIRDRLATIATRPNAVADSSWRLGLLARRLGDDAEAVRDFERATSAAPLNTKYLFDAGVLALQRRDPARAAAYFTRIVQTDPADADGVAGAGLAAIERGDRAEAARLAARARAINPRATLERTLALVLETHRAWPPPAAAALPSDPSRMIR